MKKLFVLLLALISTATIFGQASFTWSKVGSLNTVMKSAAISTNGTIYYISADNKIVYQFSSSTAIKKADAPTGTLLKDLVFFNGQLYCIRYEYDSHLKSDRGFKLCKVNLSTGKIEEYNSPPVRLSTPATAKQEASLCVGKNFIAAYTYEKVPGSTHGNLFISHDGQTWRRITREMVSGDVEKLFFTNDPTGASMTIKAIASHEHSNHLYLIGATNAAAMVVNNLFIESNYHKTWSSTSSLASDAPNIQFCFSTNVSTPVEMVVNGTSSSSTPPKYASFVFVGGGKCYANVSTQNPELHQMNFSVQNNPGTLPCKIYYHAGREDNFTLVSNSEETLAKNGAYVFARNEGKAIAGSYFPSVSTELEVWYHDGRGDHASCANPVSIKDLRNAGYRFVGTTGFVYKTQQPGTVPLILFYHESRGDHFSTCTAQGKADALAAGYREVRTEGFIFP